MSSPDIFGDLTKSLPEERIRHVQHLANMVGRRRAALRGAGDQRDLVVRMSERGDGLPPISIVGDRGAGKTTLLMAATAALAADRRNLVLETVKPELFSSDDSLFVHVLVGLERIVAAADVAADEIVLDGQIMSAVDAIDMALRSAALSRTSFEDRLHFQTLGPDQFASDFARLSRTEASFLGMWRSLVAGTVKAVTGSDDGLLIVPIDDADLVPDYLPRLFLELRLLTASPKVMPIVCLNLRETRTALLASRLQSTPNTTDYTPLLQQGLASTSDVKMAVEKQLTKALPADFRFVLTPVDVDARLDFRPLDSMGRSLRELLRDPEIIAISGDLVQLFESPARPGVPARATFAANALPGAPRELGILCALLNSGEDEGTPGGAQARLAAFLEALGQFAAFGEKAFSEPETLRVVHWNEKIQVRQRAENVWIHLGLGVRGGSLWSTEDAAGYRTVSLGLSPIGEVTLAQTRRRAGQSRQDIVTDYWPDEFAAAFVVIQDLSFREGSVIRAPGSTPAASLHSGSLLQHVNVSIDGEPTDDRFFDVPAWASVGDVSSFAAGWNRLLNQSDEDSSGPFRPVSHVDLEWVLCYFISLVVEISEGRPGRYTDRLLHMGNEEFTGRETRSAANRTRLWKGPLEGARRLYSQSGDEDHRQLFRRWFECDICQLLHPALLPAKRIEQILGVRERALSAANRWQRGNDRAIRRLEERAGAQRPGLWLDGLVDLARRLDAEEANDMADRIRGRRLESKIARLGRAAAVGAALPSGPASGTKSPEALEARVERVLDRVDEAVVSGEQ